MALTVFIFYGETRQDAEKALALSQQLEINESKPLEGIGEQAYQLAKEDFAWITFRKANVYAQVNAGILRASETDDPAETGSVIGNALIESARLFALLIERQIPAT